MFNIYTLIILNFALGLIHTCAPLGPGVWNEVNTQLDNVNSFLNYSMQ